MDALDVGEDEPAILRDRPLRSLHRPSPTWLERVRFVLVSPSHPGNVGSVARAMRVMGLRDLVVVSPRFEDVAAHPDALAFASGADDVLAASREVSSLAEALADATLAIAVSAEMREFGPEPATPERAAALARAEAQAWGGSQARGGAEPEEAEVAAHGANRVAFVFGPERTGLSIADVQRCQALCSIPGDPDYNSLNLAQAAQIVAYCLRREAFAQEEAPRSPGASDAAGEGAGAPGSGHSPDTGSAAAAPGTGLARPATLEQVEGLFAHLERALVLIGFLDPRHPKKLMPRIRRLLGRTRLEAEEVDILRGVCTQIEKLARDGRAPSHPEGR